jgi:malic enzyme
VGAAIINGLKVVGKDIKTVKLVTSGAGAAALACLNLLVKLGMPRENIFATDLAGVVYEGRKELMDEDKLPFARKTSARTLSEDHRRRGHLPGPVGRGVLKPEMVKNMAASPLILALANPNPEITPEEVKTVRSDAIMATGAPTTRTRSTTSCASPTSSAARWIRARRRSPWRWRSRPSTPLPSWRRRSKAKWWPRPMPGSSWPSAPST